MPANIFSHVRDILWGKTLWLFGAIYSAVGFADLVKSEFLPERYQSWSVLRIVPHWQWRTWAIGLLALLFVLTIQGSYEFGRRLEAKLNQSQKELELERTKYARPILRGAIERFYSTQFSPEEFQSDVRCDIELLLKVVIFNESPCQTTVRSFGLTIEDADGSHPSENTGEAENCVVQLGNPHQDSCGGIVGSKIEEDLLDLGKLTMTTPITRGVHREGWLLFIVKNVRPKGIDKALFRLTAADSVGFSHQIAQEHPPIGQGRMYKVL